MSGFLKSRSRNWHCWMLENVYSTPHSSNKEPVSLLALGMLLFVYKHSQGYRYNYPRGPLSSKLCEQEHRSRIWEAAYVTWYVCQLVEATVQIETLIDRVIQNIWQLKWLLHLPAHWVHTQWPSNVPLLIPTRHATFASRATGSLAWPSPPIPGQGTALCRFVTHGFRR